MALAHPAILVKVGMPRSTAVAVRAVAASIWASLSWSPARLVLRFSTSPSQPFALGLGDAVDEGAADLQEPGPLGGIGSERGTSQAGFFESGPRSAASDRPATGSWQGLKGLSPEAKLISCWAGLQVTEEPLQMGCQVLVTS